MFKWLLILLAGFAADTLGQGADVGVVSMVSGAVTYVPTIGAPAGQEVQGFMKLREGDTVSVARGAQVRVAFFSAGR